MGMVLVAEPAEAGAAVREVARTAVVRAEVRRVPRRAARAVVPVERMEGGWVRVAARVAPTAAETAAQTAAVVGREAATATATAEVGMVVAVWVAGAVQGSAGMVGVQGETAVVRAGDHLRVRE